MAAFKSEEIRSSWKQVMALCFCHPLTTNLWRLKTVVSCFLSPISTRAQQAQQAGRQAGRLVPNVLNSIVCQVTVTSSNSHSVSFNLWLWTLSSLLLSFVSSSSSSRRERQSLHLTLGHFRRQKRVEETLWSSQSSSSQSSSSPPPPSSSSFSQWVPLISWPSVCAVQFFVYSWASSFFSLSLGKHTSWQSRQSAHIGHESILSPFNWSNSISSISSLALQVPLTNYR